MGARLGNGHFQGCAHCQPDGQSWNVGKTYLENMYRLAVTVPFVLHDVGAVRHFGASVFLFNIGEYESIIFANPSKAPLPKFSLIFVSNVHSYLMLSIAKKHC